MSSAEACSAVLASFFNPFLCSLLWFLHLLLPLSLIANEIILFAVQTDQQTTETANGWEECAQSDVTFIPVKIKMRCESRKWGLWGQNSGPTYNNTWNRKNYGCVLSVLNMTYLLSAQQIPSFVKCWHCIVITCPSDSLSCKHLLYTHLTDKTTERIHLTRNTNKRVC